ncbi:DUF1456 family protein [Flavobacterium psychrotolerans]|uniref:DUF1456 domain-containing protein n=1 Tax=Flavobacterium psychrotolerans TaxID=2169410 RepID=A0A2U1JIN7_9FLAO|nr:DUF1456 family protein [Flavobacterium psychrotolerans]PWA05030.1 DUF1456 domain-containing protein [Flavobacterium psychrotolerans]
MNNNDIFKKLRVALMLRDDQIIEILELVDFRMSKGEIGNIFRNEDHPNFMECGDQVLRNFLNGLVIHLRGTKENPKNPNDVLAKHKAEIPLKEGAKERIEFKAKPKDEEKSRGDQKPSKSGATKKPFKKAAPKIQVVEKVKYNFGKNKKS